MNRDGKEEKSSINTVSHDAPTVSANSSTVPLRLMPAALRFTPMELRMLKNAHGAATIRYGATTV